MYAYTYQNILNLYDLPLVVYSETLNDGWFKLKKSIQHTPDDKVSYTRGHPEPYRTLQSTREISHATFTQSGIVHHTPP